MKFFELPLFALVVLIAGCATGGEQQATPNSETEKPVVVAEASIEAPVTAPVAEVKVGEFASLATGTLLKSATHDVIEAEEMAARGCEEKSIAQAHVTQQPAEGSGMWIEQWAVKRCGTLVWYNLRFVPRDSGDTIIILTRVNRQAVILEESGKL